MSDEFFPKSATEVKSRNKQMILTDKQLLAINRDKVIKYFCDQWRNKYGIVYMKPAQSFVVIEKPIADALASNYTIDMLCLGIDAYLNDDFAGYVSNSHPLKFFTKDISRWVTQAERKRQKFIAKVQETDNIKELNEKYGILKKGDGYLTEDGKFFVTAKQAVAYVEGLNRKVEG